MFCITAKFTLAVLFIMKIKTVLSLITFALSFSLAVSLVSLGVWAFPSSLAPKNNAAARAKISAFLATDAANRQVKVDKLKDRPSGSCPQSFVRPIAEYAAKTENMNLAGLPEDFQLAWLRYSRATDESVDLISHLRSLPQKMILNEEEKNLADEKFSAEDAAWKNVVATANEYGVDVR